ncbi:asparaginase [Falsirhodobacter sp. 20TX0035]|uniref:asparaginase n=1 Tax=Falsirhodobacter sp. 20TX0035 TaxID=3022019 RepID=UPI00232C76C3|nr:asparaginase [Falsirhodobacter sp. 20TX0035]MDB6453977.1 asparaginase [Falsirhodobacter sp. 20TX0035]
MTEPVAMAELWRGGMLESVHAGHAVICGPGGQIVQAWGDPTAVIFPRSSCKMLQALPLVESGAAEAFGLTEAQLALACASHSGSSQHVRMVERWLADLGTDHHALRCGSHMPGDTAERDRLIRAEEEPCPLHNNCSGKHAGFLTLNHHLGGDSEYVEIDHPVQRAVKAVFEDVTEETSTGVGIDGCSAPNFTTSVQGLARAMAFFAEAREGGNARERAAHQLTRAMAAHPDLIAGEGRADTELMRAMDGVAMKVGAEAVYVAILPEQRLGVALKITDGSVRAAEAAIARLLVKLGVLDYEHPATRKRLDTVQTNWRGLETGVFRTSAGFGA